MTELFPYQREGVKIIRKKFGGRCLLADDPGLGKSIQSLTYGFEGKKWPIIVVCDALLKFNWQREVRTHLGMRSTILNGLKAPKKYEGYRVIIVNWEILKAWVKVLKKIKPQLIIVDECQRISNRNAKRTKHVRQLCRGVPHVIMTSGTPLTNRPAELFPALNILRPDVPWFRSFYSYGLRYCGPRRTPWGIEYKGATRLKELNRLLEDTVMLRRLKKNVIKQLPPLIRTVVPIEINAAGRKEYKAAVKDFAKWMVKNIGVAKARRALKAKDLVMKGYLKRLAAKLSLEGKIAWIDQRLEDTEGKIIVFAWHKSIIKQLKEHYGKKAVVLDGSVPNKKRAGIIDQFTHSKKIRLMLANNRVGGIGWNGTAADTVVSVELGWTPADLDQTEARAHRIGATKKVNSFILVAHDTIEEKLCDIVQGKSKVLGMVLDGGKGNFKDIDIFDQLTEYLLTDAGINKKQIKSIRAIHKVKPKKELVF